MKTLRILKDNCYRKNKSGQLYYDVRGMETEFDELCEAIHRKLFNYKPDGMDVLGLLFPIVVVCVTIFFYFYGQGDRSYPMDKIYSTFVSGIVIICGAMFAGFYDNISQRMKAVPVILEKLEDETLSAEERLDNLCQIDVFQSHFLPFPDKYVSLKRIKKLLESSARCGVKSVNVIEKDRLHRPDYEITFNDGSCVVAPGIFCVFYPIEILDADNEVFMKLEGTV